MNPRNIDHCPHCKQHRDYAMKLEEQILPVQDVAAFWQREFDTANARAKKAEDTIKELNKQLANLKHAIASI